MKKQLYNCKAWYETKNCITVQVKSTRETITLREAIILTSYNSVVLIYDTNECIFYFMPRYAYSATTWQHIRKFFELLHETYAGAYVFRKWFAKPYTDAKPYVLCDGFYYGGCPFLNRW